MSLFNTTLKYYHTHPSPTPTYTPPLPPHLVSVLSSAEVLSTDEESSGGEDESDNELGRNLETLLQGKKTTAQLNFEQEEAERVELRRFLSEDRPSRTPECAETSDRGRG